MKKLIAIICLITMMAGLVGGVATANSPPRISSPAAVVIDYDSGEILYEKDANSWRPPSSISKVLTAFVAYEEIAAGRLSLSTVITVSANAAAVSRNRNIQGSYVTLTSGAKFTVDELLHLMLLPSSNGACVVIAEHISGSEAEFAKLMNKTGESIGMRANFNNSHGGIPNSTTARSIGILVRTFIERHPDVLRITSKTSASVGGTTRVQTNLLLRGDNLYRGADGFKTGTTREGGYCLASTALRNGKRIIVVVLGGANNTVRYSDSRALLDFGFAEAARRDATKSEAERREAERREAERREAERVSSVTLDGVLLEFDVQPRRVNGRVMVPYRAFVEALDPNVELEWNQETREATVNTSKGDVIKLTIGSTTFYVNDERFDMDVAPMIDGNRTLVPLRFVAEAFGMLVEWDNPTKSVTITSPPEAGPEPEE